MLHVEDFGDKYRLFCDSVEILNFLTVFVYHMSTADLPIVVHITLFESRC